MLQAKYAESSCVLFAVLRPSKPPPLDTLAVQHTIEVLAVDEATCQIHLEKEPSSKGTSCFSVEGTPIHLSKVDGALCRVEEADMHLLHEGAEVEQEQFISDPNQVFQEFIDLWQPRWNQNAQMRPEHWTRILNFTRFLRPVASFDFPLLHRTQWLQAIHKMKKTAARGPDAYARLDLLNMAPCHVDQLLELIHAIESGRTDWPLQLLQGFVCAVDKQNQKQGADGYRPITLLSVIYRVWASIRTRQLLRALQQQMPEEMFGFVPEKETADLWISLQAKIETACQLGQPLTGCVADVVKAFNGLPRGPLLRAAARLGFPQCVLTPWVSFISQIQRRFVLGESVSAAVHSSSGFIEGDPLSVTAMSVASILYHAYLRL